jgi:hypothetical protein
VLDSCGNCGKVETPQGEARGGSTHAPRKASTWNGNQPLLTTSKNMYANSQMMNSNDLISKKNFERSVGLSF